MSDRITLALSLILDCVCDALDDTCPCAVYQTAGMPAWDNCCADEGGECAGGQLTGNVIRTFPYVTFPISAVPPGDCRPLRWAAEVAVVLLRCHPILDGNGEIDPDALDAAAKAANADMDTIRWALQCCEDITVSVTEVRPQRDPSGGCFAIGARLFVDLSDRRLRPDPDEPDEGGE